MQNSNRPRRIVKPFGASAGSGFIRSVPVAAQPNGAASYEQGFPPETFQPVASGGVPPAGQDVNGILFDATGNAAWSAAGGMAQYDSAYATAIGGYPQFAVLAGTTPGTLWQSTVDGNMTNPDAGGAGWIALVAPAGTTTGNYERRASGILEQWGEVSASASGETVISVGLPVAYADGTYVVTLTPIISGPSINEDMFVQLIQSSRTTDGFSVQYQRPGAGTARLDGFTWRAIGR